MNNLSVKLSLLFAGLALLSIGALAVWVNQTVNTNFTSYCQQHDATCMCVQPDTGMMGLGQAEQAFLRGFTAFAGHSGLCSGCSGCGAGYHSQHPGYQAHA